MDEVDVWQSEVRALLAISEGERTEDERIRLWARRVRLLMRGWRVVLGDERPVFQYVGNADCIPQYWQEILKDRFKEVKNHGATDE